MAHFFYLTFALFNFHANAKEEEKFCTKYKGERTQGNVIIGHFSGNVIPDRFLNDTKQKEFSALNETYCVKTCVKDDPCRTISVVPDTNTTNVTCYLSESNIYETDHVEMKGAKIIMLGTNACDSTPCMEGSKCKPDYKTGGYSCSDIGPDVHVSFDKNVEPICKDEASCMTIIKTNAKIMQLYDAKTPVLMTKPGATGVKFRLKGMDYFGKPLATPRNMTVGIWAKYSGEISTVNTIFSPSLWTLKLKDQHYQINLFKQNKGIIIRCEPSIPMYAFNSWNHLVARVTEKVATLSINGIVCGRKSIENVKERTTGISYVSFPESFGGTVVHFIDSLSIYQDFKSDQYIKNLYEREKKNFVRSKVWLPNETV